MEKGKPQLSKQPKGIRLPIIRCDEDVDTIPHLNDEEKAAAKENLRRIPPSDGWLVLTNDPEMQAVASIYENALIGILAPDFQGISGGSMNLICHAVGRLAGCEWMSALMAKLGLSAPKTAEGWDPAQLAMLAYPDSALWSEEQRLTLKFVEACFTNTMTDELFAQARETWGEKRLLRHIFFIGYVHSWAMLENSCNLAYTPVASDVKVAPDETEKLGVDDVVKGLRSLWNSKKAFVP
ncbi:MAG: hypothetical protein HKP58_18280 [Desulfatitalea sp.]|nr:hypothetical protein [Desulfatitalea sp.]NNK02364.1 hypothetical protein [Desulfatitalea sp.]